MKLALALSERADLQRKLSSLGERMNRNAKVQEGEKPSEDPMELIQEMESIFERLEKLVARINHTNHETMRGDTSLLELLAKRDCLKGRINKMKSFIDTAGSLTGRYYSKTEIKTYSTVPVAEMQKKLDGLSKEFRLLDDEIQEINWTTELL